VERARVSAGAVGAALVALVLAGCAGPQYTYVRDDDGGTYFKVPATWRKVDQKIVDQELFGDPDSAVTQAAKKVFWVAAYDAHATPSMSHLLVGANGNEDQPFVFAKVKKLTETERNQVSLDQLRNSGGLPVVLPEEDRQLLETSKDSQFKDFQLVDDQVLPIEDGVRGIRSVFNYRVGNGPLQTFDETAYLSADGTQISTLLIRCSATCYRHRSAEIDTIAQSFKVKRLLNQ
jgi:hypothetical protein